MIDFEDESFKLTRRSLLLGGLLVGAGLAFPVSGFCHQGGRSAGERTVHLHNIHTGESLQTVYWADGNYLPDSLQQLNWLLRDYRTDQVKSIDPKLFDLLRTLRGELCECGPVEVISGFRSKQTNDWLRRNSNGVAKHSLHMKGMAIDIRMPGCELKSLRKAAVALRAGGVGYYPKSQFVHIDTGRVRYW